jgi:hypothetical protein
MAESKKGERLNKRKKVAWHKHLKAEKKRKEKQRASAQVRPTR